jgi:hypothetical protein
MFLEIIAVVTVVAAALLAFGFGGRDEQLAAIGFLAATLATRMITAEYQHVEYGVLAVDFGLLLGLLALALTSDRSWPMYATAFQLVGLLVHIGSLTSAGGGMAWAYAVGLIFWSYAVIAALLAGTWLEGRNRRLAGL